MRKFFILRIFVLLLAVAGPAAAQDFVFLSKGEVDLTRLLAPPPDESSDQEKRDLAAVIDAQKARTPPQVERAVADNAISIQRFSDVLGPRFEVEQLPAFTAFFNRMQGDSRLVVLATKDAWNRRRPFLVSDDVLFVGAKPGSVGSYPSGHATFGYLTAIVLAEMLPEKRAALFTRGREYGDNRVIAGVHFPTDVEAGRIAATVIAAALMRSPAFRSEFETAKAELRRVLGL
jgi:acid phosphatase (class A)